MIMKTQQESPVSSESLKPRQHRNREVSSRFLSSTSTSTNNLTEYVFPLSPSESIFLSNSHSPLRRKSGSSSFDSSRSRNKKTEEHGLTRHQLWPSSSSSVKRSSYSGSCTLADHITEERFIEYLEFDTKIVEKDKDKEKEKPIKKSSNFSQNNNNNQNFRVKDFSFKENDRPGSVKKPSSIVPGRLSVDENALYRKSRRNSFSSLDSESDYSDAGFLAASRKMGIEVSSKYMSDVKTRKGRRGTSVSNILDLNNDSSASKKHALKTVTKKAYSLTGLKNSKSQWALSPGRSGSPIMSVESMDKSMSFSSLKQCTSPTPTKAKGVERILSMGFNLFKSKKTLFNSPTSSTGFGNLEAVQQLRMLDNRLMQWRYANARAQVVNDSISYQAENTLIYAWHGLTKLRLSVLEKRIQFEREKLQMKINFILYSQMELLKAWAGMERQHISAITVTKESLHSVVCRIPLLEGAKEVDKTAAMLSELAKIVAQEKHLLQEFYDFFQTISIYEGVQSLKIPHFNTSDKD
ncbi:putative QWRF family protein [Lupinus albus]|uniref:Putative QWRF family protein n=1 Tax=Lupinus albus TaxID=3870 RepID=A0A6A4P4Y8_LUPAL|nr:putative QWRF family protein [Lupinus albus]